jgi:hypothetical protein
MKRKHMQKEKTAAVCVGVEKDKKRIIKENFN